MFQKKSFAVIRSRAFLALGLMVVDFVVCVVAFMVVVVVVVSVVEAALLVVEALIGRVS